MEKSFQIPGDLPVHSELQGRLNVGGAVRTPGSALLSCPTVWWSSPELWSVGEKIIPPCWGDELQGHGDASVSWVGVNVSACLWSGRGESFLPSEHLRLTWGHTERHRELRRCHHPILFYFLHIYNFKKNFSTHPHFMNARTTGRMSSDQTGDTGL